LAAVISASVVFVTQVATLIQIHKHRQRAEAFERSQMDANNAFLTEQGKTAQQYRIELEELSKELAKVSHLQTRWDPVRFEIYAEVLSRADQLWPVVEELANLAHRRALLIEDKENGRMDSTSYEAAQRTISDQVAPFLDAWELGQAELDAARGRADMIASPPVRDAVTELGHSLEATRNGKAGRGSTALQAALERFVIAKDEFRQAVRLELGSDHYAAEELASTQ
jgi:hypothetical protein